MAVGKDGLVVSDEQIAQWQKDEDRLMNRIVDDQAELAAVRRKLEAVSILREWSGSPPASTPPAPPVENGDKNMMLAVERLVTASVMPLERAKVKKALAEQGFPAERLGNYFYTVVKRLKDKKRIAVQQDGKLARPRPQLNA